MKTRTRFLATQATASALARTLASCGCDDTTEGGGTGDDDGGGGEATALNLLVPSYSDNTQKLWEEVIDAFESANDDITVNLEVQSWDNLESVIATKVQGDQAPDIYNGGPF